MREHRVTLPELALIGGTRGMIGLGAGLLISEYLGYDRRRMVGWALLAVGALSTIPIALRLRRGMRPFASDGNANANANARSPAAAMMAD